MKSKAPHLPGLPPSAGQGGRPLSAPSFRTGILTATARPQAPWTQQPGADSSQVLAAPPAGWPACSLGGGEGRARHLRAGEQHAHFMADKLRLRKEGPLALGQWAAHSLSLSSSLRDLRSLIFDKFTEKLASFQDSQEGGGRGGGGEERKRKKPISWIGGGIGRRHWEEVPTKYRQQSLYF